MRDLPPPYARALLFDVDGVLTDGYARPDVAVLRELAAELSRGAAIGLVTGRSRSWLAANILGPLSGLLSDARVAARLALACEFGGHLRSRRPDRHVGSRGTLRPPCAGRGRA